MPFPVSTEFAAESQTVYQRALARIDVTSPTGEVLYTAIRTVSGDATEDATRAIRRTCNATFVDRDGDLNPRDANDLLAPLGNELRLYRGLFIPTSTALYSDVYDDIYDDVYGELLGAYSGVSDEWVPLGVFGISRPTISSKDGGVTISVTGYDRARRIQRARLSETYTIAAGADLDTAIGVLLINRWSSCPNLVALAPPVTLTHRVIFDVETDPWDGLRTLCEAHGTQLDFDCYGVPTRKVIPDPTLQVPVATYTRDMNGLMTDLERTLDDEETYSGVTVTGESTSGTAPVRSSVWDDDPLSPTWRLGKFGQVPYFYTSPLITTAAQALKTATAMLPKHTGVLESAEWGQIPNAALQADDVVAATDDQLGLSGQFSLESVTTDLRPSMEQRVRTRARQLKWS